MDNEIKRDGLGRFQPGCSGNPSGRPRVNSEVKELLKAHSIDAARKVIELLNCGNHKVELAAAQEILNRTEGKPTQVQDLQISGYPDLRTQIKAMLTDDGRGTES